MLFVGDDWAEDHHDVEVQDELGHRLRKARVPEGIAGIASLHDMIAEHLPEDADPESVVIGIETDRGPWVAALVMAGYQVFAINPRQVARFKERYSTSGAKSDAADAHALADMVRTERHQLRPIAGDSAESEAIRVVARAHQGLIWERTRHTLRLRSALREFFPAALDAFSDLTAPDTLELLGKAADPTAAARLTTTQVTAALQRARRRGDLAAKADAIRTALRRGHLTQPDIITDAYAATVRAQVAVLATLNEQIKHLEGGVEAHFGQHPDAEIYLSQPGMGTITGARVLGEFGDDPTRYAGAKSRKNYAGTSPITRQSGKSKTVTARFIHNNRLIDALQRQAFSALSASPGARAYYDELRGHQVSHNAALRQLANRLVGILHGCLKTGTTYDEATAWRHHTTKDQQDAA
ncbi:MAG: IS110 family transposase [Actinobacteria bacterium]|nr:IS110 family transposase [Actinomycetota bacterium]